MKILSQEWIKDNIKEGLKVDNLTDPFVVKKCRFEFSEDGSELHVRYPFTREEEKFMVTHNNAYWRDYASDWEVLIKNGEYWRTMKLDYTIRVSQLEHLIWSLNLVKERISNKMFIPELPVMKFWENVSLDVIHNEYANYPDLKDAIEREFYTMILYRDLDPTHYDAEFMKLDKDSLMKFVQLPSDYTSLSTAEKSEIRKNIDLAQTTLKWKYGEGFLSEDHYDIVTFNPYVKKVYTGLKPFERNFSELKLNTENGKVRVFYNSVEEKLQLGITKCSRQLDAPITSTVQVDGLVFANNFGTCDDFILAAHDKCPYGEYSVNNIERQNLSSALSLEGMLYGQGGTSYIIYENNDEFLVLDSLVVEYAFEEDPREEYINGEYYKVREYTQNEIDLQNFLENLNRNYTKLGTIDGPVRRWMAWSVKDQDRITGEMQKISDQIKLTHENPDYKPFREQNVESIGANGDTVTSDYVGGLLMEHYVYTKVGVDKRPFQCICARLIKFEKSPQNMTQ